MGAASLSFIALYGIAVRTRWGQRLDVTALRGTQLLSARDVRVAQSLHTKVDIAAVTLIGGAILLVAWLRGRRRLVLGVTVMCIGSFTTSEVLKRLLVRPRLTELDSLKNVATYPSGHTTIAMALTMGAILVAPRRARASVSLLGGIFAGTIGCSLLVTASHRPSDIIGAAFVVTAWSAATAAILLRTAQPHADEPPIWTRPNPWIVITGVSLAAVAFGSAAAVAVAIHHGHLDTVELGRAFVGAASAIYATSFLCTGAMNVALHNIDLDEPTDTSIV